MKLLKEAFKSFVEVLKVFSFIVIAVYITVAPLRLLTTPFYLLGILLSVVFGLFFIIFGISYIEGDGDVDG